MILILLCHDRIDVNEPLDCVARRTDDINPHLGAVDREEHVPAGHVFPGRPDGVEPAEKRRILPGERAGTQGGAAKIPGQRLEVDEFSVDIPDGERAGTAGVNVSEPGRIEKRLSPGHPLHTEAVAVTRRIMAMAVERAAPAKLVMRR